MAKQDKKTRDRVAADVTSADVATETPDAPTDTLPGVSVAPQGPELAAVYIVAGRKNITSARGILGPGDRVTPAAFAPGVFEAMIQAGAIVRA
jgi:hypothetical protein